jgi:hypothetical protein
MKKWIYRVVSIAIFLLIGIAIYLYWRLHDRHPDYTVDIDVRGGQYSPISAGFAAIKITPQVIDEWMDLNQNYQYDETDTFIDKNNNGKFDPVWMAGFNNNRPAQGVHDDLWARTMVIDDGKTRLAIVSIDAIGFGADDVIEVKKSFPTDWKLTTSFITSTHTHNSPDLIGLWGKSPYTSGVDEIYLEFVKAKITESVKLAIQNLRPAVFTLAQDLHSAQDLVTDTRKPDVYDYGLRVLHATDAKTDSTLGTLISWANHPETLEDKNLLISSDFPHYLRESFEKGITRGDSVIYPGKGGVAVYVNGAIGGLMTTWSDFTIRDMFTEETYAQPSFKKAEAQGQRLALLALKAVDLSNVKLSQSSIQLRAKTIELPLDNKLYRAGAVLGIFTRGLSGWWKIRTEVAIWRIGPAVFVHIPGELYPEIANGGIESPAGNDFSISPIETPALRELMPGEFKFVIGLSNDMIGYIIPKSQWDEMAPFTYGQHEAPYGEVNSVGPETAPLIYTELKNMLKEIRQQKQHDN